MVQIKFYNCIDYA